MTDEMEKMPCMLWMEECLMVENSECNWQSMGGLMTVEAAEVAVVHAEGGECPMLVLKSMCNGTSLAVHMIRSHDNDVTPDMRYVP